MSTSVAEILKEIHRLRLLIKSLEEKIEEVPRQLRRRQADVEYHQQQLRDMQEHIKHLKVQAADGEKSIKATSELIEKKKSKLSVLLSKKEYQALENEISHAYQQISDIEDKTLPIYDEITEKTDLLSELEKKLQEAKDFHETYENESEERLRSFREELEKSRTGLVDAENSLPEGDFRVKYERLVRQKGEDAFSGVRDNACLACYITVTPQSRSELARGELVFCKSCSRLIYLA